MRGLVGAAIIVSILLSGCAGDAGPTSTQSTFPLAETARADEATGSIAGTVLDDEARPIPRAQVALLPGKLSAETDGRGKFTFNDLQPGDVTLVVSALGYDNSQTKVSVAAGSIAEPRIVLRPLAISEAYIDRRPFVAYIKFGESFLDIASHEVAPASFCDPCHFYAPFTKVPKEMLFEATWTSGVNAPLVNTDIFYLLCKNWQNGTTKYRCGDSGQTGTVVKSGYYTKGTKIFVDEAALKDTKQLRLDIHAGTSVGYELKVKTWMSFAYGEKLPEGYTALQE